MKTSLLLLWAAPALAQGTYLANLERAPDEQVCDGARALVSAQQEEGWSWERGKGAVALNASGVVAAALGEAAGGCGIVEAVERYARAAERRHLLGEILFDPDVEALAQAAARGGKPRYLAVAREVFERRHGGATGEELVGRWLMLRRDPQLLGFDAAAAIRAALAVGERERAEDLARAVVRAGPSWAEGHDRVGWLTTSRGALLEALARLGSADPLLGRFQTDLVHHLMLTQSSEGSWGGRNTQATAFAVRGLKAQEHAAGSAALGRRWLRLTQLQGGGWASFNDLLPEPFVGEVVHEVTAEVLLALR